MPNLICKRHALQLLYNVPPAMQPTWSPTHYKYILSWNEPLHRMTERHFCATSLVDVSQDLATGLRSRVSERYCDEREKRLLTCFRRASSWSMIPAEVVKMILPNERAGNNKVTQFSIASKVMLNRGEMTPVLFNRPLSWMTILPPRWSSTISNSPM